MDKHQVIGERTQKSLAEKKRADHVLGKPEYLTKETTSKGRKVRQRNARQHEHNRQAVTRCVGNDATASC